MQRRVFASCGPGRVHRRPRPRAEDPGWRPSRQGPLRQPEGGGLPGDRVGTHTGGSRTLDPVPLAPGRRRVLQPRLKPLPEEAFETGRWFTPRVDRYSQITVRTNQHSVPVRLIGQSVRVLLHANDLVVYDGRNEVARHERLSTRGGSQLVLDHYLEALIHKPGAFPGSTALEQARSVGRFTPVHDNWWAAVRSAHGDAEGTRALIQVLLLGRHMRHEHVVAGLAAAFRAGALTADAVALEARRAAEGDSPAPPAPAPEPPAPAVEEHAKVTFLADYRLTHLPPDTRPLPSVAAHDQLLNRRRTGGQGASQGEAT
ncbi:hypothetical protein ACFWAR_00415 [Streptomyces sp. NPDC059917]|uniref:Mu transposase domain-containing protein n=1 Tax=Streptomyces sp. NPDC059917 TaxID=3347002 RepID=UPI003649EA7F